MDRLDYHNVSHSDPSGHEFVGGVNVYPTPITLGEHINIVYDGLLFNCGATDLYLHVGYGRHESWQNVKDVKMLRTGRGWEQTFEVDDPSRLNFCFKDSANNWDNNNGHNWSYEIHNG